MLWGARLDQGTAAGGGGGWSCWPGPGPGWSSGDGIGVAFCARCGCEIGRGWWGEVEQKESWEERLRASDSQVGNWWRSGEYAKRAVCGGCGCARWRGGRGRRAEEGGRSRSSGFISKCSRSTEGGSGNSSKQNIYVVLFGISSARPNRAFRRGDCSAASVATGCCGRRVSGCAMHWHAARVECQCVFGRSDTLSVLIGPLILILYLIGASLTAEE